MQNRRYLPDRCEFKFAARVRTATVTHDVELIIIQRQLILFDPILIDRSYCIGVVSNKKFFSLRRYRPVPVFKSSTKDLSFPIFEIMIQSKSQSYGARKN
jgi:hypothetical protein